MTSMSLRNEIGSELVRTRRRGVLGAWLGLTGALAALINTVMFSVAASANGAPANGPGVDFPSLAALLSPDGLTAGVASASSLLGVVTLAFWSLLTASDYNTGLVRLLVAAQPRRWRLLAGKVTALTLWTAVVAFTAIVVNLAVAPASAHAAGLSTAAWTSAGLVDIVVAWANLFSALLAWGVIGLALATVTRSAAVAISVGVGYVLLLEGVLASVLDSVANVLPGSVLTALAQGGTNALSAWSAVALGLLYATIAIGVSLAAVQRRDVTD